MKGVHAYFGIAVCAALSSVGCSGGGSVGSAQPPLQTSAGARSSDIKPGDLYVGYYGKAYHIPPGINTYDFLSGTLLREYPLGFNEVADVLAVDSFGELYAAEPVPNLVATYSREGKQGRPITDGIVAPYALAVDSDDNLFVANADGRSVTVYRDSVLKRKITDRIADPEALAIDSSDNLYVANQSANQITEYAPGKDSVLRTIEDGVSSPNALAVDREGILYVANPQSDTVTAYRPGEKQPFLTISRGVSNPHALAVDGDKYLYIANKRSILDYNLVDNTSLAITDGVSGVRALVMDGSNLCAANEDAGTVTVYARDGKLLRTITVPPQPLALAVVR